MKAMYGIGTVFIPRGKIVQSPVTVVDIYTTKNSVGDVVKIEYQTKQFFMDKWVNGTALNSTIALSDEIVLMVEPYE